MSKFDSKKMMPRYSFIAILLSFLAAMVMAKMVYTMTAKRDFWMQVADRVKIDSLETPPVRGNILSCDGQLMASSLPQYKLYIDFRAMREAGKDSLFVAKLDSICMGLNSIFPDQSTEEFHRNLMEGYEKNKAHWPIWKRRVNYSTYSEVKKLPVFRLGKNRSGFHVEEFNARKLAYGSLAQRTIGKMYGEIDSAQCGLEQHYDSLLRGDKGIRHRRKVLNKYLYLTDTPPENGADIVTTIDVSMQDLAERAVLKELYKIDGNVGVAIVMEVATGDVKAIVNLTKCADGTYQEIQNHAVSDLLEPGSVFKTASIMVALDDGVVDTTYTVDTGCGVWPMYGREMKDHNWRRGGYGMMTLPKTLWVSSNIGVSRIIDDHYHNCPEKFVQGIHRLGLADDLPLPLAGSSPARIRFPKKDKRGKQYINWSKTTLPWMSIGYETQVPPISTLTFYNAIANGGKMMRPRFVKEVRKDGETVMTFPPVVMREHIAKETTIKKITRILEQVVSVGLGKKAGSPSFLVAGKTGTAQISKGAAGYKSGQMNYLLSFAGFFPAYEPRYSCIVCLQKSGLPASGGGMSGVVFHDIAEGIMAQSLKLEAADARDSLSIMMPDVKNGNILAADYVLSHLGFKTRTDWDGSYADGNPIWGRASESGHTLSLQRDPLGDSTLMPDVHGMGARDAVYLIESRGVKVKVVGRGKVTEQSIGAGEKIKKNMTCVIKLS